MADEDRRHAMAAEIFHFERQQAEQPVPQAGIGLHPALAPRPYLRADIMDALQT
jgi:hypothetical protein